MLVPGIVQKDVDGQPRILLGNPFEQFHHRCGRYVRRVVQRSQFLGRGIYGTDHVEPEAPRRRLDELPLEAPDHGHKGCQHKVGAVHEEHVALPFLGLLQQGLQLPVVVLPLRHRVSLRRQLARLPGPHAQTVEELPGATDAATDADELFDAHGRFLDATGRALPEGGLDFCPVPVQLALWLVVVQQPQPLKAGLLVQAEVVAHGVAAATDGVGDVLMPKFEVLHPDAEHSLLNDWVRMVKHFIFCGVRICVADVYRMEWHIDLSLVPQIYDAAPFI